MRIICLLMYCAFKFRLAVFCLFSVLLFKRLADGCFFPFFLFCSFSPRSKDLFGWYNKSLDVIKPWQSLGWSVTTLFWTEILYGVTWPPPLACTLLSGKTITRELKIFNVGRKRSRSLYPGEASIRDTEVFWEKKPSHSSLKFWCCDEPRQP